MLALNPERKAASTLHGALTYFRRAEVAQPLPPNLYLVIVQGSPWSPLTEPGAPLPENLPVAIARKQRLEYAPSVMVVPNAIIHYFGDPDWIDPFLDFSRLAIAAIREHYPEYDQWFRMTTSLLPLSIARDIESGMWPLIIRGAIAEAVNAQHFMDQWSVTTSPPGQPDASADVSCFIHNAFHASQLALEYFIDGISPPAVPNEITTPEAYPDRPPDVSNGSQRDVTKRMGFSGNCFYKARAASAREDIKLREIPRGEGGYSRWDMWILRPEKYPLNPSEAT